MEEASVFILYFQISQESVEVLSCEFVSCDLLFSSPFAMNIVSLGKLPGPVLFFSSFLVFFYSFKQVLVLSDDTFKVLCYVCRLLPK